MPPTDRARSIPAPPKRAEPKVKGVAYRSVLASLVELEGEAAHERALARLPPAEQEMLRYLVINTGWYPISLYRAMWKAILAETGGDYEVARELGALAIRRDMTGVYRLVFKVLSPETVYGFASRLFNNYYDTGKLTIVEAVPRRARACYEGCEGFDRAMWEELVGSAKELIKLAGGRDVKLAIVRGGQDASPNAEMLAEWR